MWLVGDRGTKFGLVTTSPLMVLLALACERETPVPAAVARAAKAAQSAEVTNAAVTESGNAPLGAALALTEQAFESKRPPAVATATRSDSCALDQIGGSQATELNTVSREETIRFVGWAADGATSTLPPVVMLELSRDGASFYAKSTRLTKRPDVATALKVPAFVNSGYDLLASFQGVSPGEYAISVVQVTEKGTALICGTRKKLKVE